MTPCMFTICTNHLVENLVNKFATIKFNSVGKGPTTKCRPNFCKILFQSGFSQVSGRHLFSPQLPSTPSNFTVLMTPPSFLSNDTFLLFPSWFPLTSPYHLSFFSLCAGHFPLSSFFITLMPPFLFAPSRITTWGINRGYYTVARRYEFIFEWQNNILRTSAVSE